LAQRKHWKQKQWKRWLNRQNKYFFLGTNTKKMQPSKKARKSPKPEARVPDYPELVLLDKKAKKADKARGPERERHNAELRAAAAARAATQQQEEQEKLRQDELTLEQNAQALLEMLKSKSVLRHVGDFYFFAEFTACSFQDMLEGRPGPDATSAAAGVQKLVTDFLKQHPVPALRFSLARSAGPFTVTMQWSMEPTQGAVQVHKKRISQREVVHLSRSSQTGEITGMCSNLVKCSFDEERGIMRGIDDILFELAPMESEEPRRPRRGEDEGKRVDVNLRKPVNPAFFAGDFHCVQNAEMIRVYGPKNTSFRNKNIYLSASTVQPDTPEHLKDTMPSSVIGFHVWDQSRVILVTSVRSGVKIFTIDVTNMQYKTQVIPDFFPFQSQVVVLADARRQRLFLFDSGGFTEYEEGPAGFDEVAAHDYRKSFRFAQNGTCFCIQQGKLCIGFDSFVALYNFDQIRQDVKVLDEDDDQRPAWQRNCSFYVTCNKPSGVIFVSQDSTRQLLVSSAEGTQVWTLPRME